MGKMVAEWWDAIWPNLVASAIWTTPAFVTHHLLIKKHIVKHGHQAGKKE